MFITINAKDDASAEIKKITQNVNKITKAFENMSKSGDGIETLKTRFKETSEKVKESTERIKESSDSFKKASEQAKKASEQIGKIPEAGKEIGEKVSKGAEQGRESLKKLGSTGKEQAGILESAFDRVASAVAAAFTVKKLFDLASYAVTTAADAETSFAKVQTLLSSGTDVKAFYESVRKGSREAGVPLAEFTEALYQSLSASVAQGSAVKFTTEAAKLARGGYTDLATAVDVLTTIQNAYGLSASQTTKIADRLITTQNLGKVNVAQLAAVMGRSIPVAKSYNVSLETLFASYAALTKNGNEADETTTLLNATFNELGKYGTKAATILKAQTGKSFSELMASGVALTDVIGILQDAASRAGLSLSDLFSSAEAARGGKLILDNAKDITNAITDMGNSMGAAAEANTTMLNTYNEQLKQLKTNWGLLMEEVGRKALPGLNKAVKGLTKIISPGTVFDVTASSAEEARAKMWEYIDARDEIERKYGERSPEETGYEIPDLTKWTELTNYIEAYRDQIKQLTEANQDAGEAGVAAADMFTAATEDYVTSAQAILDQYQETYESVLSNLENFFSPFEKVNIKVKTSMKDMMDGMQSQIDYFQTYNQNIQTLTEAGLGSFSDMLIGMGPTGAAYAQSIVDAMNQAGGATSEKSQEMVQNLLEMQTTLEQSRENLSGSVSDAVNGTTEKIAALTENYTESIANWDKSAEAMENAKSTVNAFAAGLTESQSKIMEAAGDIGKKITDAIQANVGEIHVSVTADLPTGGSVSGSWSSRAIGMDYVPYNGLPAILHRGEAILTSYEADQWRRGRDGSGKNGITINQYIESVPQTPVQLAAATEAYFQRARWI